MKNSTGKAGVQYLKKNKVETVNKPTTANIRSW